MKLLYWPALKGILCSMVYLFLGLIFVYFSGDYFAKTSVLFPYWDTVNISS